MFFSLFTRPRYVPQAQALTMNLSPSSLFFSATEGGGAPAAQEVTISFTGDTPPLSAAPVVGTVTDPDDIINTAVITGSGPTWTLTVTPKEGPSVASFSGSVEITHTGATNAPLTLDVDQTVSASGGGGATFTIEGNLHRFDSGTGSTQITNGVPLQPGQLSPSDLGNVSLWVGGVEKQIYIEALEGRHSDGSVVSVLVQTTHTLTNGTPVAAELRIGTARGTADVSKVALNTLTGYPDNHPQRLLNVNTSGHTYHVFGVPPGAFLPSDVEHLRACDLIPDVNSAASDTARGGTPAQAVSEFEQASNAKWAWWDNDTHPGAGTGNAHIYNHTYYDRGLTHYQHWIRTADPDYWQRACSYAWNRGMGYYKPSTGYQQPEGYAGDPYHLFAEGQLLRYWATGDQHAYNAVYYMTRWWLGSDAYDTQLASRSNLYQDPRNLAHVLAGWIACSRMGVVSISKGGSFSVATKVAGVLDKILGEGTYQDNPCYMSTGVLTNVWDVGQANTCTLKPNSWMFGILCEKLIYYYHYIDQDARIPTALVNVVDWLHGQTMNLVGGGTGVPVVSGGGYGGSGDGLRYTFCGAEGNSNPAPDITPLIYFVEGWVAGDQGGSYATNADAVFNGGRVEDLDCPTPLPNGTENCAEKLFQQCHRQTPHYTAYRFGLDP